MEERTIKAICIDNKTEEHKNYKGIPVKENLKGLTKDKEYEVKQSKEYEDYFEVMNDLGKIETYKKYRFEVVDGEKMEEIKRVRCIKKCKEDLNALNIGEEYPVLEESIDCYLIANKRDINDTWYSKELFEKVTDDVLMVECIDNNAAKDRLTIGKVYKVIEQDDRYYLINDDLIAEQNWGKGRFKPVEPRKEEKKEYSVMELFEEKEETKFKIEGIDYEYFVLNGILRRTIDGTMGENIYLNKAILKAKFIKVEEPKQVTTSEAMKALEEGKTIESVITKDRYSKRDKTINIDQYKYNYPGFSKCLNILSTELENNWIIL